MVSSFHWNEADDHLSVPALTASLEGKRYFVSVFGSANTNMPPSNKLRRTLFEHCHKANLMSINGSTREFKKLCAFERFDPKANRDTVDIRKVLAIYERSMFCLVPPGDTGLRKGIFDALLAGCIPVLFFDEGSVHPLAQFDWHLAASDLSSIAVRMNYTLQEANVVHLLLEQFERDPAAYTRMLAEASRVALRLQYSHPRGAYGSASASLRWEKPWRPPFEDAFDITMQSIFRRLRSA